MLMYRVATCALVSFGLLAQEQTVPNSYSIEKEEALGRQLSEDLRSRAKPIDSPMVQAYLERIGQRIASNITAAPFSFKFAAIEGSPCQEPAALPGGYIVVSAQLFAAVRDEAEFAAILAHAMQHVALRHGTRQATRAVTRNYASIPLIFFGGQCGASSLAIPAALVPQQRLDEQEADSAAAGTLARAGFDPKALERYIQRLPNSGERQAALTAVTRQMPPVETTASSDEFEAVQQEVRRLTMSQARAKQPPTLRR